jgi:hypothetical protein
MIRTVHALPVPHHVFRPHVFYTPSTSTHVVRSIKYAARSYAVLSLSKFIPVHAMKAYGGSGDTTPLIINLDTRLTGVVGLTSRLLYNTIKDAGTLSMGT